MRNPKPKPITPKQELELKQIEETLARAEILQLGVQKILEQGEYCDCLEICSSVLAEAALLRIDAFRRRAAILPDGLPYRRYRRRKRQ